MPMAAAMLSKYDEETQNKIREDARTIFEEKFGPNVLDPQGLLLLIIVA